MSERTPLQILQYYADGGHYYSDAAQWAIERITELEALIKDIREDYQQDMKDYGIHNAKKMEAKLKELEAEKDRAQYMICEKHPYLTTTSPTASALGCPYCKLDAVKNLGEQE